MRTSIQKFGKTLMGPLSIIVASGLLLGIVSILQNPALVGETVSNAVIIQNFIGGVRAIVSMMFGLLPILFAISVATGMAKEDKEIAGFAVVIAFIIFHVVIGYLLQLKDITLETTSVEYLLKQGLTQIQAFEISNAYETMLGVFTYRMGVFGGILVGLWTAFIHNRYHTKQLPTAFSFFSGNRFVPIVIIVTIPFISIATFFIWPYFNSAINGLGTLISKSGAFGTFMYGFSERLLIPTGLHHVLNQLIRFTPIGGTAVVDGQTVSGALTIFNSVLASPQPDIDTLRQSTRFLTQGSHAFMLFGLPAACFAMYKTAYLKNRPKIKGMLLASALTAFVTGITEPIEFAFIFISPVLWIFHAFMAGLSFFLMTLMNVAVGNAGGGMIDLTIFGILQGTYTRWYLVVLVGIAYAVIYYYVFKFVILKFNVKTPGRNTDSELSEEEIEVASDGDQLGATILKALGGKENVVEIDNCISRLRLILNDTSLVNESLLKATGSMGLVKIDTKNIQVVYGPKVEQAARSLKKEVKK
ncbi:PTS transporter subunit EIIC [Lederbergia lenta]|uniref:PTS system, glucose-specific enzyme II, ABC component n=1 Tax=Lederbergia lenta TaxID=1467 RepID=A0A2X4WG75_LEDLE|nr:PTS transporter subunit EIIC [Lederbergia lenta]MCM3111772.1 PTS transporter subunit EIIC [Lederbergia lenta]MEC2322926.1 PTS transporter subunit EIIC [Lederbergia lenta]SQI62053.1 PTS system, glucose-specific enzyme II, ABC component [Lederbergia lenta]